MKKKLFIFFTVYIIAMVFALDFGYDAFMSSAFEKELAQAGRYIAETPMTIISEELSKMPPEDIPSYIAGYSKKYDYPIEIKKNSVKWISMSVRASLQGRLSQT